MSFAKVAKVTPTYFRARTGALGLPTGDHMLTKEQAEIAAKAILVEKERSLVLKAEKRARWNAKPGKWTRIIAVVGGLVGFMFGFFFLEIVTISTSLGIVAGSLVGRYFDRPVPKDISKF